MFDPLFFFLFFFYLWQSGGVCSDLRGSSRQSYPVCFLTPFLHLFLTNDAAIMKERSRRRVVSDRWTVNRALRALRDPVGSSGPPSFPARPCFLTYRRRTRLVDAHGLRTPARTVCSSARVCVCVCLKGNALRILFRGVFPPRGGVFGVGLQCIAASLPGVLSFFALNWESQNWRLPTPDGGGQDRDQISHPL